MKVRKNNGTVVISPNDGISFLNAEDMKEMIVGSLQADDKKLILDMENVNFVDSAGLGVLISLLKEMNDRNGEFIVTQPQLGVQKLIEMTKLDTMINIEKTPETITGDWSAFDENGN